MTVLITPPSGQWKKQTRALFLRSYKQSISGCNIVCESVSGAKTFTFSELLKSLTDDNRVMMS